MDVNDLRIGFMVGSLLTFVAIAAWAWRRQRRTEFEQAARLPFVEGETAQGERP